MQPIYNLSNLDFFICLVTNSYISYIFCHNCYISDRIWFNLLFSLALLTAKTPGLHLQAYEILHQLDNSFFAFLRR